MKKIALAILAASMLFSASNLSAQGKYGRDSAECIKYLSYYSEHYKQKNYDEALPSWRQALKLCPPQASENLFIHGSTLLRRAIVANAKDIKYKDALIDSLIMLHNTRMEYYPKKAVSIMNSMGLDLHNYIKEDNARLYSEFKKIIEANKGETDPNIFLFEIDAARELVQSGAVDPETFITEYQKFSEMISAEKKAEYETLFAASKIASCDNLLEVFGPRYEANPNDKELVSNIVKLLSMTEGCTNNDLYLKAVTTMHAIEPSYTSAYYLFKLLSSRGENAEAIKYMEEAINSSDSDEATDAEYNYELAVFTFKAGMAARAFAAARKAAELNPALAAKAYFLLGSIWGNTVCQGNEIERRAPYWVAVDFLNKAKNADPSLTDDANNLIRQYSAYFPQTADAFMYDLSNGQSYTVSCGGMTAVTTVRTQD